MALTLATLCRHSRRDNELTKSALLTFRTPTCLRLECLCIKHVLPYQIRSASVREMTHSLASSTVTYGETSLSSAPQRENHMQWFNWSTENWQLNLLCNVFCHWFFSTVSINHCTPCRTWCLNKENGQMWSLRQVCLPDQPWSLLRVSRSNCNMKVNIDAR